MTCAYGMSPRREFGTIPSALVLMADRTGRGPVSDSGPFRVQITWTHPVVDRDFAFAPVERRAGPPGVGGLSVTLAVLAEPGLMLRQNGAVMVSEATDDRGRSLVPAAPGEPASARPTDPVRPGMKATRSNSTCCSRPPTCPRR